MIGFHYDKNKNLVKPPNCKRCKNPKIFSIFKNKRSIHLCYQCDIAIDIFAVKDDIEAVKKFYLKEIKVQDGIKGLKEIIYNEEKYLESLLK
jgi:hypothetical protein